MQMHTLYEAIDPFFIWWYRITGYAFPDFLIGTFVLASIAVIIGEFTISLAYLANRKRIEKETGEAVQFQNLSIDALKAGDKTTYKASNKLANDAFGKTFFMQIALSSAFLWPIPFALAWMDYRFADVDFRLLFTDHMVGYAYVFVPLYAAAYMAFKRIKYRIPYFKRIKELLDANERGAKAMKSFAELIPVGREVPPLVK